MFASQLDKSFDIVIVGGGSAGSVCSCQLAQAR